MQVAHRHEVINMLDGDALDAVVAKELARYYCSGSRIYPYRTFLRIRKAGLSSYCLQQSGKFTMNRRAIRDLAAIDLGIKTAIYRYATCYEELKEGVAVCGFPCVVKPLMSSSGKGQSVIKTEEDTFKNRGIAMEGSRGDLMEVIVEEFIDFEYEITLLTLTQTAVIPCFVHR